MTKHVIVSDNQYEISYEDTIGKGFYLREKAETDQAFPENYKKIQSPFDIAIGDEEFSIVDESGSDMLSVRKKEYQHWEYGVFSNIDLQFSSVQENQRVTDSFDWHNERCKKLALTKGEIVGDREPFKDSVADHFDQNSLSFQQKKLITEHLGGDYGVLYDLKESCISKEEYCNCLAYLIQGGNKPNLMLSGASAALNDLELYLKEDRLHQFQLNKGDTCTAGDHIATLGEAKQFVQMVFQEALRQADPQYQKNVPPLEDTGSWNHLCYPGQSNEMMIDSGYVTEAAARQGYTGCEIYRQKDISSDIRKKSAELIQTIAAVYEPLDPTSVRDDATLEQLHKASQALQFLLTTQFSPSPSSAPYPLLNYSFPFLHAMANAIRGSIGNFEFIQRNFLLPLYHAVAYQIHQKSLNVNHPRPEQFQALPVHEWNGVRRSPTHEDFVNEQFKNPRAVFVITEGRGGLAGSMAPVKMTQSPDGSPVYDLCTLRIIPTGGEFSGNTEAAQEEIKKYFARLYEQVKLGRTIVVPYAKRGDKLIPAFGTGTFADSALTAELRPFIFAEFEKLENFCNGTLPFEQLDEEYRKAWGQAAAQAALPLPQITMPVESEEPAAISGKDLLNPWLCRNFQDWFDERNLGKLTEHTDEKSQTRTLVGTLSTGAQITIHNDRIELNGADKMTPENFEKSMRELIQVYINGYAPGEPPPTRALGTPEQKAVISRLLKEANIELAPDKPAAPTDEARSDDSSEEPTSQLRPR